MVGPTNGEKYTDNSPSKNFSFTGFTNVGSTAAKPRKVTVQVNTAGTNTWTPLPQASVSSTATTLFPPDSQGSGFQWSLTGTLSSMGIGSAQWPTGGIMAFKVFGDWIDNSKSPAVPHDNSQLAVFDDDFGACLNANAGQGWTTIGTRCLTPYPNAIARVLDTSHNPGLPVSASGATGSPGFLKRISTDFGTTLESGNAYYNDPVRAARIPTTLAGFKSQYNLSGFGALTAVTTRYYNYGDLGLGRKMVCNTFGLSGGVACIVTNYTGYTDSNFVAGTSPPKLKPFGAYAEGNQAQALDDATTTNTREIATVAMAFDPAFPAEKVIFAAYNGTTVGFRADGGSTVGPEGRLEAAVLDNVGRLDPTIGNTQIPGNCLSCHGGKATNIGPNHELQRAIFLPFDLENFKFSTKAGFTQADQEDAFRKQNQFVVNVASGLFENSFSAQNVIDLIAGWYGGPLSPGATFNPAYVPTSWTNQGLSDPTPGFAKKLYENVIQPYCQSCHIAQWQSPNNFNPTTQAQTVPDFHSYASFAPFASLAAFDVCGSGSTAGPANSHRMPHAEMTMKHFWESSARAHLVGAAPNQLLGCGSTEPNAPIH